MTNPINHSGLPNPAPILPHDTPLLRMPQDIITQIFSHLPCQDIARSPLFCRQFNKMLKDNDVWRILFYHRFPSVTPSRIKNFRNAYQGLHSNPTKGVYALHTFTGHGNSVCCVAVFDGKLFSGSYDDTIKVWDLKTGQCIATLTGHGNSVFSLAVFDGKLFSGASDNTIKIWDLKTRQCTATLTGHGNSVFSLAIFDGKLFSGSDDHTIKIWDLKIGQCTGTLTGHGSGVYSLAIFDGKLFSGSADCTIKVWDLKTGQCTATLIGHENSVCSLALFDGKLFSGSNDQTIKIWELKTGQCTATLTGHVGRICSLAIFDEKLFSGSDDKTIKVWEAKRGQCTATLKGHEWSVCSLTIFDGKLFSGSDDNTIKVWDFTADDRMIFQEIAYSLESESQGVANALERFSRMPKMAKDAIYGKLYAIVQPGEYPGCAEHSFHNQHGQSSTPAQKAQAIRAYLNDPLPKNNLLYKKF